MVREIDSPETIKDDAMSFVLAVKEELHDEPEKYTEFLKLMKDYYLHDRVDTGTVYVKITEIIREHPNLLLSSKALFPEEMITIPPKAEQRAKSDVTKKKLGDVENHRNNLKKMMQILDTIVLPEMKKRKSVKEAHEEGLGQLQTKVGRRVQLEPTMDDASSYIDSVKEALHNEPAKYDEFLKLLIDVGAHRINEESGIARMTGLIKEHLKLLVGLNVLLPAAKITIPPKAKITNLPKPNSTIPPEARRTIPFKARRTIALNAQQPTNSEELEFMNKLTTRFENIDTHVVGSIREIMKMYNEGKKSVKEVGLEVFHLLYYHEDLIEDFFRIFRKQDPLASTSLLESLRQKFHDPLALILGCGKQ